MAVRRETWESFVHSAVTPAPDDPHVRRLRDRLSAGARVMRVDLVEREPPVYLVLLERLRELSEQRVPHSPAFTRWALSEGVKMADKDGEVQRFRLILDAAFKQIEFEIGADYFGHVLRERVKMLAPPHAAAMAGKVATYGTEEGRVKDRAFRDLDNALRARCAELTGSLKYTEKEAADILDRALAVWIDERSHITLRELLFPRR